MKKISTARINAGKQVSTVRKTLKEVKHGLQDIQEELSETFKPIVKAQEDVKEAIDEKQDKLIEQLQKNQKAITSGFEKQQEETKLPIGYQPEMSFST